MRAEAKRQARPYLKEGEYLTYHILFLLPIESVNVGRIAYIPIGNCELWEAILDEKGEIVHVKSGDNWKHFTISVSK